MRRCRSLSDLPKEAEVVVEFWDDHSYMPFDKYSACLVAEARKYDHASVAVYVGQEAYDVVLSCRPVQTNRRTLVTRPMHINSNLMDSDDDDDDDGGAMAAIPDDDEMPPEFKCPITSMPMVKPVVASDGHTYEKRAIRRWLMHKNKSPVTMTPITRNLIPNHNLKKLMDDWVFDDKVDDEAAVAGTSGAACSNRSISEKRTVCSNRSIPKKPKRLRAA